MRLCMRQREGIVVGGVRVPLRWKSSACRSADLIVVKGEGSCA